MKKHTYIHTGEQCQSYDTACARVRAPVTTEFLVGIEAQLFSSCYFLRPFQTFATAIYSVYLLTYLLYGSHERPCNDWKIIFALRIIAGELQHVLTDRDFCKRHHQSYFRRDFN
jgi:hypothetical protein